VEPPTSDTLIAFAAKAGSVAVDGDGANSPFTGALVQHIASPGLDLRIAFGRVRDAVLASTRGRQEPFVYGSLGGGTVSIGGGAETPPRREASPAPPPPPPPATIDRSAAGRQKYEAAERIGTKEAWRSFLSRHGSGFYADLARAALAKLAALEPKPQPPVIRPPEPPPSPAPVALDSLARNFLQDYMRRSEGDLQNVLAYLPRIYDRDVLYYGKRTPAHQVIAKKQDYFSRWSQRSYRLKPDMKIACDATASSCRISGHLDYYAASATDFKTSAGVAYYEYRVVFSPTGPKIVEENGRTVSRQN